MSPSTSISLKLRSRTYSEKIEDAVEREAAQGNTETEIEDAGETASLNETDSSWRLALDVVVGTTLHLLAPAPVYAQTDEVAAPEISNPAIRQDHPVSRLTGTSAHRP